MVIPSGTKVSKHFFLINFKKHLQDVQLPAVCKQVVASFSIADVATQAAPTQEIGCSEFLSNVSQTACLFFLNPL